MADKIVTQETAGRYGWGTTIAVEAVLKRLMSYKLPTTGLLLVNIDTLIRNSMEKDLKIEEVAKNVCTYMTNIATDFAGALANWRMLNHNVVFYHADPFKVVPEIFRRKVNPESVMKSKAVLEKILERTKNVREQTVGNVTSRICLANEIRQPTYKGLAELCDHLAEKSVTVHMISHCPIDWHIARMGRIGILYRSYTGVAVNMTPTKLGKVVFDDERVPFYPVTHVLLGDKSFIKGLYVRDFRKTFIESAARERFVLRSEMYIRSHAKINVNLLPYTLE